MTRPTTTGKAQDLITFTRSTTGTALAKISYGEELVTNGDFSSDSDWGYTSSKWRWSSGRLERYNGSGNDAFYQSFNIVEGKTYKITYDVEYVSGTSTTNVFIDAGGGYITPASINGSGSAVGYFTAQATKSLQFQIYGIGTFRGFVDNVSVKEVLYDQPDGTLQLFNHPINKPRIEYDAEGNCLGLLVEEARANVLTNSNVPASGGGAVLVKNAIAPNNAQDAWTMTYSSGVSYTTPSGASFISGTAYTFSFYFKRGTGTQQIWTLLYGSVFNNNGGNVIAIYDIESETATINLSGATANVQAVGNGWYRCSCSAIATASSTAGQQIYRQGATDTGKYDYVYGFQVETGAFPTSYIPTSGSSVTRAADIASLAVSEFGYNQDQGSFVIKFDYNDPQNVGTKFLLSSTLSSRFAYTNGNTSNFYSYDGAAGLNYGNLLGDGTQYILATGMDSTGSVGVVNGGALSTSTGTPQDNVSTNIYIGAELGTSSFLNAHIKSIQYYPLRLSNAQLQALTV